MIFELILAKDGKLVHQEAFGKAGSTEISLVLGLVAAMKSMASSIGPVASKNFSSMTTGEYKLHYFESPSNYQFIVFSSPETRELRNELRNMYVQLFIPLVLQNPLFPNKDIALPETCPVFVSRLRNHLAAILA